MLARPYSARGVAISLTLIAIATGHRVPDVADAHPAAHLAKRGPSTANCANACLIMLAVFGKDRLSFPQDELYKTEQLYWSQQQSETYPACRFTPSDAQDVSDGIQIIRDTTCPFAVKCGGHVGFVGASNINDGVTFDLSHLNTIKVASDRNTTYVGGGAHWDAVYQYLDARNLAVIGGRNGDLGVGGLTLGGGISFFSGYYGWACDNVRNYEVVLGDGHIVNANEHENPDLYFAMRGGGNNFGIVTRFDLMTFEQGQMWGGMTVYPPSEGPKLYQALESLNINAQTDPNIAIIVSAAAVNGNIFFSNSYEYDKPIVNPPILDNFTSIPNISSTTRITSLYNLTVELKETQPPGFRQRFTTATFTNNATLMGDILKIWTEGTTPFLKVPNFLPSLVFQPITVNIINKFAQNGGNALGITADDGPLLVMDMDFQWDNATMDDEILGALFSVRDKAIAMARSRGQLNRYLYQNYASEDQDVFASYGPENKHKLIRIQRKYDPFGVIRHLQPGYFGVDSNGIRT